MTAVINNPITRFAVKAVVLYAYTHIALDAIQGSIRVGQLVKSRISR